MSDQEHLQIVQFLISVGLLWFGYSYIYRRTRADRFREELFTIRDQLFDHMWQHRLSYDLVAYRTLRDFLNGGIRVVDELNLFPVLLLAYLTRHSRKGVGKDTTLEEIAKIGDSQTRKHFEQIYNQVTMRLAKYVFLEGIHWVIFKPIHLFLLYSSPTIKERTRKHLESPAMAEELVLLGRKSSPDCLFLTMTGQ